LRSRDPLADVQNIQLVGDARATPPSIALGGWPFSVNLTFALAGRGGGIMSDHGVEIACNETGETGAIARGGRCHRHRDERKQNRERRLSDDTAIAS
jgi:hypothetical protein